MIPQVWGTFWNPSARAVHVQVLADWAKQESQFMAAGRLPCWGLVAVGSESQARAAADRWMDWRDDSSSANSASLGFSAEEISRLIEAVDSTEWKSLIRLGFATGMRLADLVGLTWGEVDFATGNICPKRGRSAPAAARLTSEDKAALFDLLGAGFSPQGFLFPSLHADSRRDFSGLADGFARWMEDADVAANGRSFHSLRLSHFADLAGREAA